MKKEYFIEQNGKKEGAFTLEELKQKDIYDDALVWKAGWEDWKLAKDVEELKEYLIQQPPPSPTELKLKDKEESSKQKFNDIKSKLPSFVITTIVLTLIFNFLFYSVAKDGGSDLYPIYLTRAEQQDSSLIFWNMLPTIFVISLVVTAILFVLKAVFSDNNDDILPDESNVDDVALDVESNIDEKDQLVKYIVIICITIISYVILEVLSK